MHVVAANKDEAAVAAAESLAEELSRLGLEVLFDDRPKVSPGVKFKDAELLGMPFIAILGRGFASGTVELRRRGGETTHVPVAEAAQHIAIAVRAESEN